MKILELWLQAFGPFTDVTLDFSGGREGLHVVLGPNEAGKSSALRAVRQALFGFPSQSPDDFLHSYARLRVGMRLRDREGREMAFVRRKGNKNTLLAEDGATPLPDDALGRILEGMSEAEFTRRFALDHDELVAGGKAILDGVGELGQLLFQAGGGLKDLFEVQRRLDREIEALFKPNALKPRINAALAELKDAKATVRAGSLPSSEWVEHDAALRKAAIELERVEARLEAARAERRRLERIADALPVLARRRQAREELEAMGPVVLLPDDFGDRRHRAAAAVESARTAEAAALRAIAELDTQIDALVVSDDLLAEAEAIERIRDGLAGYRKSLAALPDTQGQLRLIEDEARDILAELGTNAAGAEGAEDVASAPDSAPSVPAIELRPTPTRSLRAATTRLAGELARLTAEREQADARVGELTERLESERAELDRLAEPGDPEPLAAALRPARELGDIDAQLESARARLERAEVDAAQAVAQLPLWSGPREADEVAARPVPAVESLDRCESDLTSCESELERLRTARAEAQAEADEADARLAALRESAGVLPTEEDLARARDGRDRAWRLVRRTLEPGQAPPMVEEVRAACDDARPDPAPAVHDPAPIAPAELATAYERTVERADLCADRLRREADRIAAQASARSAVDRARRRLEQLDDQSARAAERTAEARSRWLALWASTGIEPFSPREMRGWLQARQAVVQAVAEVRSRRAELDALRARVASHRVALLKAMAAVEGRRADGEIPTSEPASAGEPIESPLGPWRELAEAMAGRIAKAAARRDELTGSIAGLGRQLEAARAQARTAADRLRDAREAWTRAIAPLGLPGEASPDQVEAVLEQQAALAARIKDARQLRTQIASLERETGRFAADVVELCRRLGPEESGVSGELSLADGLQVDTSAVVAAAQGLIRRLAAARQAAERREALGGRREQERTAARSARRDCDDAQLRLAGLVREAGAGEPEDLPAAERASRAARQLRDRIDQLDQELGRLCGHEALTEFTCAAMAVDVDRLPDRIDALAVEIEGLDAERSRLNQELGRRRSELARMDGEGKAAEANERVESLKSRLTHEVEEYARLRLASVVLREAIERYRKKSQGPVLDRAGALFAALTLGSFEGLRVDFDGDDQERPVLQAVRPGGVEAVGVRGLSLGTADQLYLALRIASLEAAVAARGPVPLIADDLLVQFDDARTAAALEALAVLSDQTQVILFTHHDHVAAIARERIADSRLFIHHLPGRVPVAACLKSVAHFVPDGSV